MIIKTKRHKTYSFSRLIPYILGEEEKRAKTEEKQKNKGQEESFTLYHNLHSREPDKIIQEFKENERYRKHRKNGVVLYHEILSFHPKDKDKLSEVILEDLSRKFVALRGENALCIAKPHFSKEHIHLHFCFSGTEYKSSKNLRLDNSRFKSIRLEMEQYQKEKYPELSHSLCYLDKKEREKAVDLEFADLELTDNERQLKNRTKKPVSKEIISDLLQSLYSQSTSQDDFFQRIVKNGMEVYKYRNKVSGIKHEGHKFRFKTLTITEEHVLLLQQNYRRLKELEMILNGREKGDRDWER